jgi:S1-C subfamily serine protease
VVSFRRGVRVREAAGGAALYLGWVPGDLLDLILIVLAAAFAVAGYRQGFIVGVLSCIGFLVGAAIGATFSPALARLLVHGLAQQALVAIIVVFITAMIGQLLASLIGVAARSKVTWRPAATVDALGGAAVSVVSVLLIAWFIGSAVVNAPFPAVARQVRSSEVLRGVGQFMPSAALSMFSDFRHLLDKSPYTQVFGVLGVNGALNVPAPDQAVLRKPAVRRDRNSIVKVRGVAQSCDKRLEGSGFVISPDHVLTNAHVVAGVNTGLSVVTADGVSFPATVVRFDPQVDVAVLYVPHLPAPPLRFATAPASKGNDAIVAGYPLNRQFTAGAARVSDESSVQGPDIYRSGNLTRQIYEIRALVEPGNSGGPLLAPNGAVYGVVFAAAVNYRDTGYALTAGQVRADAQGWTHATRGVSTERCSPAG